MGAEGSKQKTAPVFTNLNEAEISNLKTKLSKASAGKTFITVQQFENIYALNSTLHDDIINHLRNGKNDTVQLTPLMQLANLGRGDVSDQAQILIDVHKDVNRILEALTKEFAKERKWSETDRLRLMEYFQHQKPQIDRLSQWLVAEPIVSNLTTIAYSKFAFLSGPSMIPLLFDGKSNLLDETSMVVLNSQLPMERRHQWSMLFNSEPHGSSFSQLSKRINGEGPCLVVVEATDGKIFGCFASAGFLLGPQYRGDATSFIFSLRPTLRIFSSTARTNNYAYMNVQQSSLPNGLGIGGSDEIWPFFLHEEYGKGIAMSNLTAFEHCSLAENNTFEISRCEVWRVGEKAKLSEEEEELVRKEKSILDKDPQARALLEMSGRKMHSEAYRDPEPILDVDASP